MKIDDMKKTWMLRCFVVGVLFCGVAVLVATADDILHDVFGFKNPYLIETMVFCGVLGTRLWDWAAKRVWIGTKPTAR